MEQNKNKTLRLRLKLKTGEEFEAEGDFDFIMLQKQEFLKITNSSRIKTNPEHQHIRQNQSNLQNTEDYPNNSKYSADIKVAPILKAGQTDTGNEDNKEQKFLSSQFLPSYLKQSQKQAQTGYAPVGNDGNYHDSNSSQPVGNEDNYSVNSASHQPLNNEANYFVGNEGINPAKYGSDTGYINASDHASSTNKYPTQSAPKMPHIRPAIPSDALTPKGPQNPVLLPNQEVWDKIALYNGSDIILREKNKNINTAAAALIILGAAKVLRDISSMTALDLSKCLKLSGYLKDGERLDRAISAEVKESSLLFEGSKRNRSYIITQKGLAKAFTTAERAVAQ